MYTVYRYAYICFENRMVHSCVIIIVIINIIIVIIIVIIIIL